MTEDDQSPETQLESGLKICQLRVIRWLCFGTLVGVLLAFSGCSQNTTSSDAAPALQYELDLDAIKQRYRSATSYFDDAQVILQYTLNGIAFEEVHPFSSHLVRDGFSEVHRFKMNLVGDDQKSVARILDVASQNLDGQVLCRATSLQDSWASFSDGSIARHFARGIDDIPWNKSMSDQQVDDFLLVTEKLFLGTTPQWMVEENLVESTLVEVNDVQFVDAAFKTAVGLVACRFDIHENALVGLRLPKQLLADEIAASNAVKEVSFAILFSDVSFDVDSTVEFKLAVNEKPVSQLMKLPESFPSPMIGKPLESWSLKNQSNQEFDPATAKGSSSIYIYGSQNNFSNSDLKRIENLATAKPDVNFAWITPPGLPLPIDGFQFSRMGHFSDSQGEMLKQMSTGNPQFCFITDPQGVIQFVAKPEKNWLQELGPTLERVARGDQVAQEMHAEYSSYYQKYQTALQSAAVNRDFFQN